MMHNFEIQNLIKQNRNVFSYGFRSILSMITTTLITYNGPLNPGGQSHFPVT